MRTPRSLVLEHAWLPGADGRDRVVRDVAVRVADGRFTAVDDVPDPDAERVPGLTLPGLANVHSHAFHRALRGRTHHGQGSFWTWREAMYAVAGHLDPDSYHRLARAAYREMVAAGWTTVGEFHYLHHRRGGATYDDPNAMASALVAAARDAGIRLTLLDTCYLAAGIGRDGSPEPLAGVQQRFGDGTADAWVERADELGSEAPDVRFGAALHSVRAVPLKEMERVVQWADRFETPLHVHLSEQPAENEQCLAAYGRTPTEVLAEAGVWSQEATAVHATHLSETDVRRLGGSGVSACFCPTTERDLGDGIGPSVALAGAGSRIVLGSDSHAVVDPWEEMRALELDHRLLSRERGHWQAADLLTAATRDGHGALGYPGAGRIAVGAPADLVTLDLGSPRTAGTGGGAETAVFAATAADVTRVQISGRVVFEGDHAAVGAELAHEIDALWAAIADGPRRGG